MSKTRDKINQVYEDAGVERKSPKRRIKEDKRNLFVKKKIVEAFSSDAGIVALAYIAQTLCGHNMPDAVMRNKYGNIDNESTMYNVARRSVYLELRRLLPNEVLKQAEFYQLSKETIENDE